jgi:hypothetical protein
VPVSRHRALSRRPDRGTLTDLTAQAQHRSPRFGVKRIRSAAEQPAPHAVIARGRATRAFEERGAGSTLRAPGPREPGEIRAGGLHFFAKRPHAAKHVACHGEGCRGVSAAAAPRRRHKARLQTSQR